MGVAFDNKLLIVAGALDGSSGLILSIIMCRAMNRSFTNVLFGAFGTLQTSAKGEVEQRPVRSASPEEAASIVDGARLGNIVARDGAAMGASRGKEGER